MDLNSIGRKMMHRKETTFANLVELIQLARERFTCVPTDDPLYSVLLERNSDLSLTEIYDVLRYQTSEYWEHTIEIQTYTSSLCYALLRESPDLWC